MSNPFDAVNDTTFSKTPREQRPKSPFKADETVWEPESLKKARAKSQTLTDAQARARIKRAQ